MYYNGFRISSEKETEELKRRYFDSQLNGVVDNDALIWSQDNIRLGFIRMIIGLPVSIVYYKLAVEFETYRKELYDEKLNANFCENDAQRFADAELEEKKTETPEWLVKQGYVLVTHSLSKLRDDESYTQFLHSIITSGNNREKILNRLDENLKPLRIFQGMCDTGYEYELAKVVNK